MKKDFGRIDQEMVQMSPSHKAEAKQQDIPAPFKKGKTITIEIDSELSETNLSEGEMSPAYKNNLNFKRAAAKMPAVGNETRWPRKDNYFMGKQSLSYQEAESKIWINRIPDKYESVIEWTAYGVLGIMIGATTWLMDLIEESLIHFKDHYTQHQIDSDALVGSWLFYASFSAFLGVVSCTLTTYWGPGAAGSGVAEVIAYSNGVNYPLTIDIKTLITKIFGVVLAIAGTLAIGKEGPLAHIGANLGALVLYTYP